MMTAVETRSNTYNKLSLFTIRVILLSEKILLNTVNNIINATSFAYFIFSKINFLLYTNY